MHRFYLPPEQAKGTQLFLSKAESHHALHVLRVRQGERVTVLDGQGQRLLCAVSQAGKHQVALTVEERETVPPLPYRLTLFQAMPKGKTMDLIVQKATELGVSRIVPLLAERTVSQVESDRAAHKVEKWEATCVEAIKQCGSAWLPAVEPPATPSECLARGDVFDLQLIASLQPGSRHPREYFQQFAEAKGAKPRTLGVWIGPEGDFTPDETAMIQDCGGLPITLGPLVLRSETAAIYCLSVLNYELQSPDYF